MMSRLVVLSFWAVAILLGLPFWWRTTTVYRASLPISDMLSWSDGQRCQPVFPVRVGISMPQSMSSSDIQTVLKTAQHTLDDSNEYSAHHLRLVLPEDAHLDSDTTLAVELSPTTSSAPVAELSTYTSTLAIYYPQHQFTNAKGLSDLAIYIARELQTVFAQEQMVLAQMNGVSATKPKKTIRPFKYAPNYHLTFSLFTPTSSPSDWEIESALDQHVRPLLNAMAHISTFTIDTQVQLFAEFSPSTPPPTWNNVTNAWNLKQDDLGGFVNAAEWPLSPSIGAGPTINFVLYIPAPSQTPLLIGETETNSWLVPQWGAIQIFNPPLPKQSKKHIEQSSTLGIDELETVMTVFTAQLLTLLGLPESPKSLPIRLSTLTRIHTASLLQSTASTIGALARLTKTLPSIAIPNSVASSVQLSMSHLDAACNSMKAGQFQSALEHARFAEAEAEKAFFERSMVGQVYFPEEHKVAVYLPLLGPIAVPMVMSAIKEFKQWRTKRRLPAS